MGVEKEASRAVFLVFSRFIVGDSAGRRGQFEVQSVTHLLLFQVGHYINQAIFNYKLTGSIDRNIPVVSFAGKKVSLHLFSRPYKRLVAGSEKEKKIINAIE